MPRSANCGRLMPPGAAFCPVFGGAFTVQFVTFSVVMGDGTDLNVTTAIDAAPSGTPMRKNEKQLGFGFLFIEQTLLARIECFLSEILVGVPL